MNLWKPSTSEKKNPADLTFEDLWSEIKAYSFAFKTECESYFGSERFASSLALKKLNEVDDMLRQLQAFIHESAIDFGSRMAEAALTFSDDNSFYDDNVGRISRQRIVLGVAKIGVALMDIGLFLKVIKAYENGERAVVYAGSGPHKRSAIFIERLWLVYWARRHL